MPEKTHLKLVRKEDSEGPPKPVMSNDQTTAGNGGNDGDGGNGMAYDSRVGKLEQESAAFGATLEGLKHSQNIHLAAVVGVGAILLTAVLSLGFYSLEKMDESNRKIENLPAEMRGIADSITNAITAARSTAPQVIVVPMETPKTEPVPEKPAPPSGD